MPGWRELVARIGRDADGGKCNPATKLGAWERIALLAAAHAFKSGRGALIRDSSAIAVNPGSLPKTQLYTPAYTLELHSDLREP